MRCSRCEAEATTQVGYADYCERCALAREWEEVIALVQQDRVRLRPETSGEEEPG